MANEVTLKESDGTIIYPQIVTDCIPNGAVTVDKIDWTDAPEVVGTYAADGDKNYALKFPDGTLICCIVKSFGSKTFSSWGNIYSVDIPVSSWGGFAVSFVNIPTLNITAYSTGSSTLFTAVTGAPTKTAPPTLTACRGTSGTHPVVGHCIAIGRWK